MEEEQKQPGLPIFVLGILPRTGIHFLSDLLALHPDCVASPEEDYLLFHADHLLRYVASRPPPPHVDHDRARDRSEQDALLASMGKGILAYQAARLRSGSKRLLLRAPSVKNLEHHFRLFPDSKLLIVVRDCRDVVESTVGTWGGSRERATRLWAMCAHSLISFVESNGEDGRHRVVRYEDLFADTTPTLRALLEFVRLSPSSYDFEGALTMPVRGSSAYGRNTSQPVTWERVERTPAFNPIGRWVGRWSQAEIANFTRVAGESMRKLGYAV